ncbi:DgyrCDS7175 [Dimorphilus gyrociliatus]|uniref:pyridoxal 5'-phosphate synthase n=1 Tax=Dimorphilus gyrociliatus TaxID=2664684 RepID=A0A7I8VQB4_9ANNE|nr:DgyrCDS7175 [Dimorphilus gyrociliatus]
MGCTASNVNGSNHQKRPSSAKVQPVRSSLRLSNKDTAIQDRRLSNSISSDNEEYLDPNSLTTKDPLLLFRKWFEEAQYSEGVHLATSMTLGTCSKKGIPSSRIVGVKGFDSEGFKIATNKYSRKALDMMEVPHASLMFYWEPMNRMVRIDGPVDLLTEEQAVEIWKSLPRAAQLIHYASDQDKYLSSRQDFIDRRRRLENEFGDSTPIPKNPDWVAFNVRPEKWEFYQVSSDLPDRLLFTKENDATIDGVFCQARTNDWLIFRLSP